MTRLQRSPGPLEVEHVLSGLYSSLGAPGSLAGSLAMPSVDPDPNLGRSPDAVSDSPVHRAVPRAMELASLDGLNLGPLSPDFDEWGTPTKRLLPESVQLGVQPSAASGESAQRGDEAEPIQLPGDIFDQVLSLLTPYPDLFAALAVCRNWNQAVHANYESRAVPVPVGPDTLARAVEAADAGDLLVLQPGVHELSATLLITKPIRIRLGGDGVAPGRIAARDFISLRLSAPARIEGLGFERTFLSGGYPNSVVHCESSRLQMVDCSVSGSADVRQLEPPAASGPPTTPTPAPRLGIGERRGSHGSRPPSRGGDGDHVAPVHAAPQTGISLGPGAHVELHACRVTGHRGPALKVCRGHLVVTGCEIAGSSVGANVVVNGGVIRLVDNDIHSATGDGISLWNNPRSQVEGNRIHSNQGAGISIRSGSGDVRITNNHVHSNRAAAFQFTTSHAHAWIEGNIIEELAQPPTPEPLPEEMVPNELPIPLMAFASSTMPVLPSVGAGGVGGVVVMP